MSRFDLHAVGEGSLPPSPMPAGPEILSMLILSTSHLQEATAGTMRNGDDNGTCYDPTDYGYLIYVGGDILEDIQGDTTPPELGELITYARSLGCDYIKFDCDKRPMDIFPTWQYD